MGRDNHNAGMHFIKHTRKVSDSDAVAYLERKELEAFQEKTRVQFEELNTKYDTPCVLNFKDMRERVHVNFYDKKCVTEWPMYHYKVLNAKNKKNEKLTLWVGYDIGGKSYSTGEIEPRGYYLYFTNKFEKDISSRKLLLFEVKRQSKADLEHAVEIASVFGKEIVNHYYHYAEIDWSKSIFEKYGFMSPWLGIDKIRCFRTIKNCSLMI